MRLIIESSAQQTSQGIGDRQQAVVGNGRCDECSGRDGIYAAGITRARAPDGSRERPWREIRIVATTTKNPVIGANPGPSEFEVAAHRLGARAAVGAGGQ